MTDMQTERMPEGTEPLDDSWFVSWPEKDAYFPDGRLLKLQNIGRFWIFADKDGRHSFNMGGGWARLGVGGD
jgi:hypothetical protein